MIKTERKYWQNGIRYDKIYGGRHFWTIAFQIGAIGLIICQPSRGNDVFTIYKLF